MVEITKDYRFTGPQGEVGLVDLFEGRAQLIIYHFMFDPEWEDGCPSCTAGTDEMSRGLPRAPAHPRHHARATSRARRWRSSSAGRRRRAGTSPGTRRTAATSTTTSASPSTPRTGSRDYNYRDVADEPDWAEQPYEMPGRSCFLRVDDRVFHTYSQYARGARVDRRLVLLPRPHRARPPGGLGGAEGPRRQRARRAARLRELAPLRGSPRRTPRAPRRA